MILAVCIAIAAAGALALVTLLRFNAPAWTLLLLLMLMLAPTFDPTWATYWHGFMHSSIVYGIYERGLPPENPLMAGEPLRYMYGHHVLIASLMRVFPISPPQGFVLTGIATLPAFAALIYASARLVTADRTASVLAAAIAIIGPTPFVLGPLNTLVEANDIGMNLEYRYIPLTKFIGINNNQVGLVFCALALYGLLWIAMRPETPRRGYLCLGASALGAGLLYPPSWLGIACAGGAALFVLALFQPRDQRRSAWTGLTILAVAAAAALPVILSFTSGKSQTAAVLIDLSRRHIVLNLYDLAALFASALLIAAVLRRRAATLWLESKPAMVVCGTLIVGSAAMFLAIRMPDHAEYKMLHMGVLGVAIPLGPLLARMLDRSLYLGVAVLALLLLPIGTSLLRTTSIGPLADRVISNGRYLRSTDVVDDTLYQWIALNTPADTIVIDSYLTVPALARRSLFVGLDERRDSVAIPDGAQDGWLIRAEEFLTQNTGVDPSRYQQRLTIARALLSDANAPVDAATLQSARTAAAGRTLLLIARTSSLRKRLARSADIHLAFQTSAVDVYRIDD